MSFFQEFENVLNISSEFGAKYDGLQDPLLQKEIYRALEDININKGIRKGTVNQCINGYNRCERQAYLIFALGNTYCCVIGAMGNPICGFICAGINFYALQVAINNCWSEYYRCVLRGPDVPW